MLPEIVIYQKYCCLHTEPLGTNTSILSFLYVNVHFAVNYLHL